MKLIRIGIFLCVMAAGFFPKAAGQTADMKKSITPGNDSLVHVAYRTVGKQDLPGAISILNPSEYLDKNYGTYPLEGINAFVGGSNLWNMGASLVLVDGVPRDASDVIASEIAQISFLKGANAVVLYGSRAANGVTLITTKRGVAGKIKRSVRVNSGINVPKSYPEYLGSAEYMKYYNQALKNDGLVALYDDATIGNYASHSNPYEYPDVDYYSSDYLRKMYNTHSANAEISGGSERARFYTLIGFQNQNSLLNIGEGKNEYSTRLNVRGNVDLKLNDFISTYVNISTVFNDNRNAVGNYWNQATSLRPNLYAPLIPIGMIDGNAAESQTYASTSHHVIDGSYLLGGSQQYLTNPIADAYAGGHNNNVNRKFQYSAGVDIDLKGILKGLTLHGQMGVDYANSYATSINNKYAVYSAAWNTTGDTITGLTKYNKDANDGTQNLGNTWNDQITDFNVHMDYVNTFNLKHNVSAMLVGAGMLRRQTGDYQYRTNSNLGLQFAYNYDHRYYADFSGAIVNSTKLSASNRVAFSPTLGLGWLVSEEGFLKGSSAINRLKLSASAGIVNTDLNFNDYYLYDEMYTQTDYFSWSDGNYINRATSKQRRQNTNLTYAKRKEVNFGVEGSLFRNLLDVKATAFLIKKDGIPVQNNTLYPSYFSTLYPTSSFVPYTNVVADSYEGLDFQISLHEKIGEVNLIVGAAGTYVATEALKRDELYADTYRNRAGKPIDAIFGLQNEGFYADQADIDNSPVTKFGTVKPGDIKYKDQNGDKVIDERDEVMIGRWASPFSFGLHFTAQWKNLSLFVLGTGSVGGTGVKSNDYYWVSGSKKYSAVVRGSWTEETKATATYPRLTTLSADNNFRYSDFWTYSTDRIDISKIQLTYSLPKVILNNSFVKNANIYVSGNNLLTIAKNKDILNLNVG
ncbi:MAG TPA: SusC/RagA family TonB-linked outer membrane protein, partial [Paludibacter sp.]|nr:SusC/RagA family TonB-linked outer membrane protein [Paludibacter sp.]